MGDRAQIAVKHPTDKDPNAKVYLYSHWDGADIYLTLQRVIVAGARLDDPDYLTRIIAREMGMGKAGDTGYGIGTSIAGDVGHIVPVVDCETRTVSFEPSAFPYHSDPIPPPMSFAAFAKLLAPTFANW